MLRDGLVDDRHFLSIECVPVVDSAAGNDRDARGFEVGPRDAIEVRIRVLFGYGGIARDDDVRGPVACTDGRRQRECRGLNAGKCGEALEQLLVESGRLIRLVSSQLGIEIGYEQMSALEAVVLIFKIAECAQKETRTHKQK